MRQWAVYACISIISETLAQLPLKLKRPNGSGGTEDATDHDLYHICKTLPNNQMTSFNWIEAQQANLLTTGKCFNFIQRGVTGVKAIYPLSPTSVKVRTATDREIGRLRLGKFDRLVYEVETEDGRKVYPPKDILHIVGFGYDGIQGESVISNFAKEAIGNSLALDKFQGAAMKNGVSPGGVLEHPHSLGDNGPAFKEALMSRYAGFDNARYPMILENGMKFNKVDVSLVDKQLIEQMKMSANQICGIFKVPPHKIGIFEKNTNYNNTEQGNRAFIDGTMAQWVVRWEQALNWKLLSKDERKAGYFFKFNFDALLRPDAKTRSELEWREWQMGTPLNEIRKRNDQNPIEGGDTPYVPVNMIPYDLAGASIKQDLSNQSQAQTDLLSDDINQLQQLEKNAIMRELRKQTEGKSTKDFDGFLDAFYKNIHEKIDGRTSLIVRSFCDTESADKILADIKQKFTDRKLKIKQLQDDQTQYIEAILDEQGD